MILSNSGDRAISIKLGTSWMFCHKSFRFALTKYVRICSSQRGSKRIVLACDTATAYEYGQMRNLLRQQGRPIADNDIWIAAVAMQYQLTLISRDAHFQEVDGLLVER